MEQTRQEQVSREDGLPVYEAPQMTTYSEEELLEELGPAQTGTGSYL